MEALIHLDTHAVVWLYAGETERFPRELRRQLEVHPLGISPAVVLELQYLFEINRITVTAERVVRDLEGQIGMVVDEASFTSLILEAMNLSWTRDPFDRLIVAHAKVRDVDLVTADKKIRKHYPRAIWGRGKR